MYKKQKNSQFMAILFVALAIFVGIFLVTKPARYESKADRNTVENYTKIQSEDDLNRAIQSLQEEDLNSIETELNENSDDASGL